MTPQLMQAIKLLQLSNLDLVAYVDAELERNPLLERETDGDGERIEPETAQNLDNGASDGAEWNNGELETSRSAIEDRLDTNLENVFPNDEGATPERTTAPGIRPRIPNGPVPSQAARMATTTSKHLSNPRRRSSAISMSSSLSRLPIQSAV